MTIGQNVSTIAGGVVGYMAGGYISGNMSQLEVEGKYASVKGAEFAGGLVGQLVKGLVGYEGENADLHENVVLGDVISTGKKTNSSDIDLIPSDSQQVSSSDSKTGAGGAIGYMTGGSIQHTKVDGKTAIFNIYSNTAAGGLVGVMNGGTISHGPNAAKVESINLTIDIVTENATNTGLSFLPGQRQNTPMGPEIDPAVDPGSGEGGDPSTDPSGEEPIVDPGTPAYVGGLVGMMFKGSIEGGTITNGDAISTHTLSHKNVGGLVGYMTGNAVSTISGGSVNISIVASTPYEGKASYAGGAVGVMAGGTIKTSSSIKFGESIEVKSTNSTLNSYVGGLVGHMYGGKITTVSGNEESETHAAKTSLAKYAGGLVGAVSPENDLNPVVEISASRGGEVASTVQYGGGLVGYLESLDGEEGHTIIGGGIGGTVRAQYSGGVVGLAVSGTIGQARAGADIGDTDTSRHTQAAGGLVAVTQGRKVSGGTYEPSVVIIANNIEAISPTTKVVSMHTSKSSVGGAIGMMQNSSYVMLTSAIKIGSLSQHTNTTDNLLKGNDSVGGFVGSIDGTSVLNGTEDSSVKVNAQFEVNSSDATIGGVAGLVSSGGNISYMTFVGSNLKGEDLFANSNSFGGIVGTNEGSLLSCVNKGTMSVLDEADYQGGIAAINKGYIVSCTNLASITSSAKNVGGIVGFSTNKDRIAGTIIKCVNGDTSKVAGDEMTIIAATAKDVNLGGIVGNLGHSNVVGCYNAAKLYLGGFAFDEETENHISTTEPAGSNSILNINDWISNDEFVWQSEDMSQDDHKKLSKNEVINKGVVGGIVGLSTFEGNTITGYNIESSEFDNDNKGNTIYGFYYYGNESKVSANTYVVNNTEVNVAYKDIIVDFRGVLVGKASSDAQIAYAGAPILTESGCDLDGYRTIGEYGKGYTRAVDEKVSVVWKDRNHDGHLSEQAYANGLKWDGGTQKSAAVTVGTATMYLWNDEISPSYSYSFKYDGNQLSPGDTEYDSEGEVEQYLASSGCTYHASVDSDTLAYDRNDGLTDIAVNGTTINKNNFSFVDVFDADITVHTNKSQENPAEGENQERTWASYGAFHKVITTRYTEKRVTEISRLQDCGMQIEKTSNYVSKTKYMTLNGHRSTMINTLYTYVCASEVNVSALAVVSTNQIDVGSRQFEYYTIPASNNG